MANITNQYSLIDGSGSTIVSGNSLQVIYDYITNNPTVSGTIKQTQTIVTNISIVTNGSYH